MDIVTIEIKEIKIKPRHGVGNVKRNEMGFEEISPSCQRLSTSMYLVKNCSGFNTALYHYTRVIRSCEYYSRKEIRGMVNNYPTNYPCLIALSDDFGERDKIFVDIADSGIFDAVAHYYDSWIRNC